MNGVHMTTERGAGDAPKPYITVKEPYIENMSEASRLCHLLSSLMVLNGCKSPNITEKWVHDMDKIMRLVGRTSQQVEACIRWSQENDFWKANILSPGKLRAKYDTMRLQAQRERQQNEPRGFDGIRDFLEEL